MRRSAVFLVVNIRTIFVVGLAFGLLLAALFAGTELQLATVPITEQVAGRRVLIDAGHGGVDPGAVSSGDLTEKEVTLGVAVELERLLNRLAVHTVMVRKDDQDLADPSASRRKVQDLERRVELGRTSGADIYVSLHANSFPSPSLSGAQTFYLNDREEGRALAVAIQGRLAAELGPNRRQAQGADYYVLRESRVPAVVVELGFLSNPREAELLGTPAYQRQLAEAIAMGIVDFFAGSYESLPTLSGSNPSAPELGDREYLLYFASPLAPEQGPTATVRQWPAGVPADLTRRAEQVLEALLAGPLPSEALVSVIPPGVGLRRVSFAHGTLRVDFDAALRDEFRGGAREERLLVESIVHTLAQFDEVTAVHLAIGGESSASIGGHIYLGDPFPVPKKGRP